MAALTPETIVAASADLAATRAAELLQRLLTAATDRRPRATLTLAGGSTPKALYRRLASTHRDGIPWSRIEILFGDERVVRADDPASNARMAQEQLLDHVEVAKVHRVQTELGAVAAAHHYAELVAARRLDVVLLGMGADGHTASLFPGEPEDGAPVLVTRSPVPPTERITMARPTLARADTTVVLVSGAAKASRLAAVWPQLLQPADDAVDPIARVRPQRRWIWVLDRDAASHLPLSETPHE